MSEFTDNNKRTKVLIEYSKGFINKQDEEKLLEKYELFEITFEPLEVIDSLNSVMILNNNI